MGLTRLFARAARTHRRRASTLVALIAFLVSGLMLPLSFATAAPLDTANTPATPDVIRVLGPAVEGGPEGGPASKRWPAIIGGIVTWGGAIVTTSQSASDSDSAPNIISRPVPGAVSSGYGYRTHPIHGGQRLHAGWDMTAGCGVPIKSGAAGRVILSGWHGGYGNTIIVDHGGGMSTLYAHQSSLGASHNEQVSAGQIIGLVGTTGMSTGCHLHYEVRINGNPVDPTPYMSAAQSVFFSGGTPDGGAVRVG